MTTGPIRRLGPVTNRKREKRIAHRYLCDLWPSTGPCERWSVADYRWSRSDIWEEIETHIVTISGAPYCSCNTYNCPHLAAVVSQRLARSTNPLHIPDP